LLLYPVCSTLQIVINSK